MDPSNYRPISLLPSVSKIFQKIVHDQIIDYLGQHDILYKYHFRFRRKHSTDLRLSYWNDRILKDLDNGLLTGMILMYIQKTLDITGHKKLLEKLKAID